MRAAVEQAVLQIVEQINFAAEGRKAGRSDTIVEMEYGRLLPSTLQVYVARIPLLSRSGDDTDVDY